MDRRKFLTALGMGALSVGLSSCFAWADDDEDEEDEHGGRASVLGQGGQMPGDLGTKGKIVVVGGGMAGTTVAKYLRLWGGTGVDVTLIEPNATYYSNIFSNMVLVGERNLDQLAFNYKTLADKYGVKIVNQSVIGMDTKAQQVQLSDNSKLPYDRLILATGIDFDNLPLSGSATSQAKIVHAWQAGEQTVSLQKQIAAMTNKDTFIITIPPKSYRCPPGPYERACVVADYLKRVKGGGKVVILDANAEIQGGVRNFTNAFTGLYKDTITYVPNSVLESIDADKGVVKASTGSFSGQVINAIPAQKAGRLITTHEGLANLDQRWAGVNVLTYESVIVPKVHIIGDSAAAAPQPKAGHVANAEAKVCASAIVNLLSGKAVNQMPMTNSACFSPITQEDVAWMSVVFRYDKTKDSMLPVTKGTIESNSANPKNYKAMLRWFDNLMSDTFA